MGCNFSRVTTKKRGKIPQKNNHKKLIFIDSKLPV